MTVATQFERADTWESAVCIAANRMARIGVLRLYFQFVTRLGNGMIWYLIVAALPLLDRVNGTAVMLHVGITALVGVATYKCCKRLLVRERPFVTHAGIACIGEPLDRGSFPSGHTLHATSFAVMLANYYPGSIWLFAPLGLSIAASRVVLGHHYPTDVVAGALLGGLLSYLSLTLVAL